MQLTKVQYWFLDTVLFGSVGLSALMPDSWGALPINRHALGLSAEEMANSIYPLFDNGYLTAFLRDSEGEYFEGKPSYEQVLACLRELSPISDNPSYNPISYRMTAKGVGIWEKYSSPRWDYYVERDYSTSSETGFRECVIRGANKLFIQEILLQESLIPIWSHYPSYYSIDEAQIWTEISPWKVSYWKSLPRAYEVQYSIKEKQDDDYDNDGRRLTEEQDKAAKFSYRTLEIDSWYENYFKISDTLTNNS